MQRDPLEEVMERLLVAAVDLGWTPAGWRGARATEIEIRPGDQPHAAWILERVGDIAYALANRVREAEMRREATPGERPDTDVAISA